MDGNAMPQPAAFSKICIWQPAAGGLRGQVLNERPDLPGGRYLTLFGSAMMIVPEQALGKQLDFAGVKVELIDAFGHAHPLDIEPEACISLE
jgi:hypothetical protein